MEVSAKKQVCIIPPRLLQEGNGVSSISCCKPLRGSSSSARRSHSTRNEDQTNRRVLSRDSALSLRASKLGYNVSPHPGSEKERRKKIKARASQGENPAYPDSLNCRNVQAEWINLQLCSGLTM